MEINAFFWQMLIFLLPLPAAGWVAWRCRRRGIRFSGWLVYAPPFLLPVVVCLASLAPEVDHLLSPLFIDNPALWYTTPYTFSVVTCSATVFLGKAARPVRARLDTLSVLEIFFLHAGMFALGVVFGLLLAFWLACQYRGC